MSRFKWKGYALICKVCSNAFNAFKPWAGTCSPRCRKALSRGQKAVPVKRPKPVKFQKRKARKN